MVAGFVRVVAVAACGTARAHARTRTVPSGAQQFQTAGFMDAAGNPEFALYAYPGGGSPIVWSMCAPGARSKRLGAVVTRSRSVTAPTSAATPGSDSDTGTRSLW